MHKLRLLHRHGEGNINNSVIKSKKRKIKISDIYTCDKRKRVRGKNGFWDWGREQSAMLDSSHWVQLFPHLFIATESLTALSVTHPAESIKHAGWTLHGKESRKWPAVSHRTGSLVKKKQRSSWEENLGGNENEKRSPLSSCELNVNVPTVVEFSSSGLIWAFYFYQKKIPNKHGCSYKQQMETWYHSIKCTILQTFKWFAPLTINLYCWLL